MKNESLKMSDSNEVANSTKTSNPTQHVRHFYIRQTKSKNDNTRGTPVGAVVFKVIDQNDFDDIVFVKTAWSICHKKDRKRHKSQRSLMDMSVKIAKERLQDNKHTNNYSINKSTIRSMSDDNKPDFVTRIMQEMLESKQLPVTLLKFLESKKTRNV